MQLPNERGESVVTKVLVNCVLLLLALLLAYFSFRGWQKSKRLWYIISTIAAILSGFAIWLSRVDGIILVVCAALLFGLGKLFKKN
jgi:Na+/melibiose symporter-like transporter